MTADQDLRASVRKSYSRGGLIWDPADLWHTEVHRVLQAALNRFGGQLPHKSGIVLDIGSAGSEQAIPNSSYVHLDLVEQLLRYCTLGVVGDAHALPFRDAVFDCVISVGPVINYCSLIEVIAEMHRVCKPGGHVIIHAELSNSCEFVFSNVYKSQSAIVNTEYRGSERQWIYSRRYVMNAVTSVGFRIIEQEYFMIIPAFAVGIGLSRNSASRLSVLDSFIKNLHWVREFSDSVIILCEKSA